MFEALQNINIDVVNNLSIISYSSTYIRYFFKKNDVEKTKQYELLLTDALQLAPVYAILDTLNISQVNIVKLAHSEMEKYKEEIKIKAIIAAKNKAELYTGAIHQTAGKALFIQEVQAIVSQNEVLETLSFSNVATSSYSKVKRGALPINLKKIRIQATVLTRFELH